jgi:hypothetical protein
MTNPISSMFARIFGSGTASSEYEHFYAQLSDIERRQLETEALTTELEARVEILEGESPNDGVA